MRSRYTCLSHCPIPHLDLAQSWEEFREAFGRMVRLKASEQRASRMHRVPPAVPPNAATDPRLKV